MAGSIIYFLVIAAIRDSSEHNLARKKMTNYVGDVVFVPYLVVVGERKKIKQTLVTRVLVQWAQYSRKSRVTGKCATASSTATT